MTMSRIELPENPQIAEKVVDAENRHTGRRIEMGWIGRFFGSVGEKPGNIAGVVILISTVVLAGVFWVTYFHPNTNNVPVGEIFTLFGGIITLALGFLFGRSGGN